MFIVITCVDCIINNCKCRFLQKRAQIERDYAKSLAKLCKDKTFAGELEIGYINIDLNHLLLPFTLNLSNEIEFPLSGITP